MREEPRRRTLSDHVRGLTNIVSDALNTLDATSDVPPQVVDQAARAITDALGKFTHVPDGSEVTKIVQSALETAGEGAGAAAEVASDIAGNIVEGVGDIDLNLG